MSHDDDRPDPIAQIRDTVEEAKLASHHVDSFWGTRIVIDKAFLISLVLIVVLALAQLLPHSDGVRGFDVLFWTDAARQQETSMPSRVFVTLAAVGTILFGIITIMTQRWWAAAIAWGTTCIASVYGVLAIWLRQDGRGPDPDFQNFGRPGIGLYLSVIFLVLLSFSLGSMLWTKSPQQLDAERAVREETRKYREASEAERIAEQKMSQHMRGE